MKKILSLALAFTLVFAMAIPAMAANEESGSTTVTYNVASSYTISIPETVTITTGTGTQTVSVNASSVIPANQKLDFKITDAANKTEGKNFRMKNDVGTDVYLDYSITYPTSQTISNLTTVFLSATPAEAYAGKTVELTYTTGTAQSAGSYTDSLTFTVGLVNITP